MEQIRKIVEVGCKGLVKDPISFATAVTKKNKSLRLVTDASCASYSFIMILEKGKKNCLRDDLLFYSDALKQVSDVDISLEGILSVKKHHSGGFEVIYMWSRNSIDAVILYNLGIRIWKKLISDRGDVKSVDNLLKRLKKLEATKEKNLYFCRQGMESLPYTKDVSIMSVGSSETQEFEKEDPVYITALKIAEVHRDMYLRHDAAFDEMHRIAKLFGLSLPTSPEEWENKSCASP